MLQLVLESSASPEDHVFSTKESSIKTDKGTKLLGII